MAYSPERIDIGGFGEGQLVLIPPGYHFSYNLRRQVAQPIMGQLQLVLTPGGQDKDMSSSVGSRWPDCMHLRSFTCGRENPERNMEVFLALEQAGHF